MRRLGRWEEYLDLGFDRMGGFLGEPPRLFDGSPASYRDSQPAVGIRFGLSEEEDAYARARQRGR